MARSSVLPPSRSLTVPNCDRDPHVPAEPLREPLPQFGGGRFRRQIEVEDGASKQGVAYRPTDEPELDALVRGCVTEAAQQVEGVRGERGVERCEGHAGRVSPLAGGAGTPIFLVIPSVAEESLGGTSLVG